MSAWVPPQHGAWAFLALPIALGATVAPASPLIALLAVAWVAAYPASYAALGMLRSKRRARFRAPLLAWGAAVVVAGGLLLVWRPWLLWVALVYLALFSVNALYARRNDERALANDAVFVLECALMVPVTWMTAAGGGGWVPPLADVPTRAWVLTVLCALVLIGSTLHVKSLVRERRDPRYARASRILAVVSLLASLGLAVWWGLPGGWWLVLPFALLAVRAFVVGRRPLRAGVIGMIELACFVVAVAAVVLAGLS